MKSVKNRIHLLNAIMFMYGVIFSIEFSRSFDISRLSCLPTPSVARQHFFTCEEVKRYLFYSHILCHIKIHNSGYFCVSFVFCLIKMLVTSFIAFFLLATANLNVYAYKSYSKYQLWRLHVTNNEQVNRLLDFSRIAHQHNINFWSEHFGVNRPVNLEL